MLITNAKSLPWRATSATRSVPLRCLHEVRTTSAPQSKAASAIRMSSVAMMSASSFSARRQRFHTWYKSGLPLIGYNGFPAKRVELQRAGIMPGNIGAEIGRVDQTISKLAQDLRFDGSILLDGEETATDSALVCNNDEFEAFRF